MAKKPKRRGFQAGGAIPGSAVAPTGTDPGSVMQQALAMSNAITKVRMGDATPSASQSGGTGGWAPSVGLRKGGKIARTAGPKIGKDDGLIPAQKGEYVVRKSAVKKLGTKTLNTINKGKLPAARGR
jgi:hypothetical protein